MISKNSIVYCKDLSKIENYQKAISDTTQKYELHHRLEIMPFSGKRVDKYYLMNQEMYYDVQPEALIFLTATEHRKLHFCGKRFQDFQYIKGSKENNKRKKIKKIKKEKTYKFSEETRKRMSEAAKGKRKGLHWKVVDGKRVWS